MKALITLFNNGNNSFTNNHAYKVGSENFWKLVEYSYSSYLKKELLKSFTNEDFDFEHDKYLKYVMDEDGRHYVVFHAMNEVSFELYTVENHVIYQYTGETIDLYEKCECECKMKNEEKPVMSKEDISNTSKTCGENQNDRKNTNDFKFKDLFDTMQHMYEQIYENGKDTIFTKKNIENTLKLMQKYFDFENAINDHLANNQNENTDKKQNEEKADKLNLNNIFDNISKIYNLNNVTYNNDVFKNLLSDLFPQTSEIIKNNNSEASKTAHNNNNNAFRKVSENESNDNKNEKKSSTYTSKYMFYNESTGKHVELVNKDGKYYINSFNVPEEVYDKALKCCMNNDNIDAKIDNILNLYNNHILDLYNNPF